MSEKSPWSEAFGPGYLDEGLNRRGIEDSLGLISVGLADGARFYPKDQFTTEPDESLDAGERLLPKPELLSLYNELIKPAIEQEIIGEYTITAWLFSISPPRVSRADAINNNPTNADHYRLDLTHWFHRITSP